MTVTEVRPDDATLRLARRARVLAEMEATGIDVLVMGREGNARYVSGAPRLWTAGCCLILLFLHPPRGAAHVDSIPLPTMQEDHQGTRPRCGTAHLLSKLRHAGRNSEHG